MIEDGPSSFEMYLADYTDNRRLWLAGISGDRVISATPESLVSGKPISGIMASSKLLGKPLMAGFFSRTMRQDVAVPDYKSSLSIIFDGKVFGDGFSKPKLEFINGLFKRMVRISTTEGWVEHIEYAAPWIREFARKLNSGGTIDYQPVDFMACLYDVVIVNRPEWIKNR